MEIAGFASFSASRECAVWGGLSGKKILLHVSLAVEFLAGAGS
jgi:hypothetical protein